MGPRRYTEGEVLKIQAMFGGANGLENLKLLRKVFLPEYDYNAPLNQTIDLRWDAFENLPMMTPSDREVFIMSHFKMIKHIERMLNELTSLAQQTEISEEEKKRRAEIEKKNSTK